MIHQQELLEEILSRLPAKSIGRFRCVSKAWKSLLSQPHFIKTHLNRINQYPIEEQSLILVSDVSEPLKCVKLKSAHQLFDEMMTALLPTMLNLDDHRFLNDCILGSLASCDGLIVVEDKDYKLLLVNPTTREIREVPPSPYALDHRHCDTLYGLGYDSITDDYMVVTLSYYFDAYSLESDDEDDLDDMSVNVYSVKNGTWKRVDDSPYDHAAATYDAAGVYVDGHIHWIANKTSDYSSVIAAFDLKEEKFREVPLSSSVDCKGFLSGHLVILEGCLCMSGALADCKTGIYVMKEYNVKESWTKLTIDDHEKLWIRPLCSLGKDQLVLLMGEATANEKLVMYNLKEETFKDIVVQGIPDEFYIKGTFVESLLSPHYVYKNEAVNEE